MGAAAGRSTLPAPRDLKVEILRDRYTLTWSPVAHASTYLVHRRPQRGSHAPPESASACRAEGRITSPGLYEFRVAALGADGREGRKSKAVRAIRFDRPWGIAVTKNGRRLVRDAGFAGLAVMDSARRALTIEEPKGYSPAGSYDVAVDRGGRILTAKWHDGPEPKYGFAVQNDRFKALFEHLGAAGSGNGEFRQPMGIGADSAGNIYVADTGNNRIQRFTREGKFSAMIGEGELRLPMKVAFDRADRLYVADSGNNRVAVFEKTETDRYTLSRSIIGMKEPVYVAVDRNGNVFVSANRVAGVHMYGPDGKEKWKYEGDALAHLSGPRGLALDDRGNLLIVDEASLRVLSVRIPYSGSSDRISSTASRTPGRGSENSQRAPSQSPSIASR